MFARKTLPETGGIKLDYADSGEGATKLKVFLTIDDWPVELRELFAWDEEMYLDSIPEGSVTLNVYEATSAANVGSASGSATITKGEWTTVTLTGSADTPTDPSSYTTLHIGNSYLRPGEAEAYFATRLETTDWDDASSANREKALIAATKMIDSAYPFIGVKLDGTRQVLQFPRLLGNNRFSRNNVRFVPLYIKEAVCEQALYLLDRGLYQDRAQLQNDGVSSFNIGGMSENYRGAKPPGLCYLADIRIAKWKSRSGKIRGRYDEFVPREEDPTGDTA